MGILRRFVVFRELTEHEPSDSDPEGYKYFSQTQKVPQIRIPTHQQRQEAQDRRVK